MDPGYSVIDHTADVAFAIRGTTLRGLFENAARCLFASITVPGDRGRGRGRLVRVEAVDRESLLRAWLAELLYLSYVRQLVFRDARVSGLTSRRLEAVVTGERYDPVRHERCPEIKAITYHGLSVRRSGRIWEATVVFDL